MDLREFLEHDMINFLEERLSQEYLKDQVRNPVRDEEISALLKRDYEQELFSALDKHNIAKAKQILHDIKNDYSGTPPGSTERAHLKQILHSLYQKFKQYLEDESTFSRIENAIDSVGSSAEEATTALTKGTGFAALRDDAATPLRNTDDVKLSTSSEKEVTSFEPSSNHISDDDVALEGSAKEVTPSNVVLHIPPSPSSGKSHEVAEIHFVHALNLFSIAVDKEDISGAKIAYGQVKKLFGDLTKEEKKEYKEVLQAHHKKIAELIQKHNGSVKKKKSVSQSQNEESVDSPQGSKKISEPTVSKNVNSSEKPVCQVVPTLPELSDSSERTEASKNPLVGEDTVATLDSTEKSNYIDDQSSTDDKEPSGIVSNIVSEKQAMSDMDNSAVDKLKATSPHDELSSLEIDVKKTESDLRKSITKGDLYAAMESYDALHAAVMKLPTQKKHEYAKRVQSYFSVIMKVRKKKAETNLVRKKSQIQSVAIPIHNIPTHYSSEFVIPKRFVETEHTLSQTIRKGDLRSAMKLYDNLREQAMRFPKGSCDECVKRIQIYHRIILNAYRHVQEAHTSNVIHPTASTTSPLLDHGEKQLEGRP